MVELDVRDHGDLGVQLEKASVGLVGLGDDPLSPAPARVRRLPVGPGSGQLAAEEEARFGADRPQRVDEHPGGGGLPVRPGDGDQPLQRAELRQQLTSMKHALAALARPRQLRIVLADRGRDDDLGPPRHRVGVVADPRLDAHLPQAPQVRALGAIRAAHHRSELAADECQPAHPRATDRDEVELSLLPVPLAHGRAAPLAASSSTAAIRAAASGRASAREAAAIRSSR